jgi:hypothetical protein
MLFASQQLFVACTDNRQCKALSRLVNKAIQGFFLRVVLMQVQKLAMAMCLLLLTSVFHHPMHMDPQSCPAQCLHVGPCVFDSGPLS